MEGVTAVKNTNRVKEILDELKSLAESDFELHRISVLEKDLTEPPKVEIIDETHQKFNGVTYHKVNTGHYNFNTSIHREVTKYYQGEIPKGYEVHHLDWNPANNSIDNLVMLPKIEHRKIHSPKGRKILFEKKKNYVCEVCGKTYEAFTNGVSHRFCSQKCADQARKTSITKTCAYCGKTFQTSRNRIQFCSKSCAQKFRSPKVEITCPVCGKNFLPVAKTRQYCSPACASIARRTILSPKHCECCGKEFTPTRQHPHARFCSRSCAATVQWQQYREQKSHST